MATSFRKGPFGQLQAREWTDETEAAAEAKEFGAMVFLKSAVPTTELPCHKSVSDWLVSRSDGGWDSDPSVEVIAAV